VIIEAVIDPFEPPMPAKTTIEQAKKMAESLLRGETDRGKIMSTILKDKIRELI
jgi:pyruvate dehydrogenase (quinone)